MPSSLASGEPPAGYESSRSPPTPDGPSSQPDVCMLSSHTTTSSTSGSPPNSPYADRVPSDQPVSDLDLLAERWMSETHLSVPPCAASSDAQQPRTTWELAGTDNETSESDSERPFVPGQRAHRRSLAQACDATMQLATPSSPRSGSSSRLVRTSVHRRSGRIRSGKVARRESPVPRGAKSVRVSPPPSHFTSHWYNL